MAINQPLKGSTNKVYSVITNFSQGIDKRTADDVSSDSSFRELTNFYNANEGSLSKRPAVYDSYLTTFIEKIIDGDYDEKFNIVTNDFGETKSTLITRLTDFYNTVLLGTKKTANSTTFELDKIVGFRLIKNTKFLEALQDYETILSGEYSEVVGASYIEFSCILVAAGFTSEISLTNEINKTPGLYITRARVVMDYDDGVGYTVKLEIDEVDPTGSKYRATGGGRRWLYTPAGYTTAYIKEVDDYIPLSAIDIVDYNGYSYIATGRGYLIKIDQIPDAKAQKTNYPTESNIFEVIGGIDEENLYAPTALELNQVGFNILYKNPLSSTSYSTAGGIDKVRGVFYTRKLTINGQQVEQPVVKVPYNEKFYIHVLYTSSTAPSDPQYRETSKGTSTEDNPYLDLPGRWTDNTKTIWECDGLNSAQRFELKIDLGEDEFIAYIDTIAGEVETTGYISEISDLVLSSTKLKVINNQLVLYGGHGYIFFSEYDMFNYFPNYYYIYIASEAGEETVTSINYFRNYYAIFTNKRIKKMVGAFGTETFGIYSLNDFIGCSNGNTVRAVGNNLYFLGNDGIYKLKQGYLGEGTENVEKIDILLDNELNLNNVLQAFVMGGNYVVVKNDGKTWIILNSVNDAFYRYELESTTGEVYSNGEIDKKLSKRYLSFYSIFEANVYDTNGDFFIIPMYDYDYNSDYTEATISKVSFMNFRFFDLDYIPQDRKHKDGYGFISSLETHNMHMGFPTNTKKFKDVYIKIINNTGHIIPLYVTIYVDDNIVVDPENYVIRYDKLSNTYYYVLVTDANKELKTAQVLGTLTLGEDFLGDKTIQQIKFRVGASGRSIRIKFRDGYNDMSDITLEEKGVPNRERNIYDFAITTIGIVYKVKKVKEG